MSLILIIGPQNVTVVKAPSGKSNTADVLPTAVGGAFNPFDGSSNNRMVNFVDLCGSGNGVDSQRRTAPITASTASRDKKAILTDILQKRNTRIINMSSTLTSLEEIFNSLKQNSDRLEKKLVQEQKSNTIEFEDSTLVRLSPVSHTPSKQRTFHLVCGQKLGSWCEPGRVIGLTVDGMKPADDKAIMFFVVSSSLKEYTSVMRFDNHITWKATNPFAPYERVAPDSLHQQQHLNLCCSGLTYIQISVRQDIDTFRDNNKNASVYVDESGLIRLQIHSDDSVNCMGRIFAVALRDSTRFNQEGNLADIYGVRGVCAIMYTQMECHKYQQQFNDSVTILKNLTVEIADFSVEVKKQQAEINDQAALMKAFNAAINEKLGARQEPVVATRKNMKNSKGSLLYKFS